MAELATCKELEFKFRCDASFEELQTIITKFSDELFQPPVIAVYPPVYPDPEGFMLHATLRWRDEEGRTVTEQGVSFGMLEFLKGVMYGYRTTTADWARELFPKFKDYLLQFNGMGETENHTAQLAQGMTPGRQPKHRRKKRCDSRSPGVDELAEFIKTEKTKNPYASYQQIANSHGNNTTSDKVRHAYKTRLQQDWEWDGWRPKK